MKQKVGKPREPLQKNRKQTRAAKALKMFNSELQKAVDAVDWKNVKLEFLSDLAPKPQPEKPCAQSAVLGPF